MKTTTKKPIQDLRQQWINTKKALTSGQINEIQAIIKEHGMNISPYSYAFVKAQMNRLGYDGIPYLDCKTFQGWQKSGFYVKKGEHSQIKGISWIRPTYKDDDGEIQDSDYVFPKEYHLFHRSQVH